VEVRPPRKNPCPNCEEPYIPGTDQECTACGIIFDKWLRKQASRAALSQGPSSAEKAREEIRQDHKGKLTRALKFGGGVSAVFLLFWWVAIKPPSGLPVPPGADRFRESGFAVEVPEGWQRLEGEALIGEAIARLRVRPEGLDGLSAAVVEGPEPGSPNTVFSWLAPPGLESVILETVLPIDVDNLAGKRVAGTAKKPYQTQWTETILPSKEVQRIRAQKGEDPLTPSSVTKNVIEYEPYAFTIHTVRGADKTYAIGVVGKEGLITDHQEQISAWISSLRVLDRPGSFSDVFGGLFSFAGEEMAKEAGLILLLAVFGFYKWVFSPLFE